MDSLGKADVVMVRLLAAIKVGTNITVWYWKTEKLYDILKQSYFSKS